MDAALARPLVSALFFLFIYLSGVWLRRSGKPYSLLKFNLHKFIGLGALVYLIFMISQLHQASPLSPLQVTAVVVSILLFAATILSGGLLNLEKPLPALVARIHKIFPYLTLLSTALTWYSLLSR